MLPYILVLSLLLALAWLGALAVYSHFLQAPGLVGGHLAHCPASPNCVCSAYADDPGHYAAPLPLGERDTQQAMTRLSAIIRRMGGELRHIDGPYLSATFTSRLWRFVDDLEIQVDSANALIHYRSASRVGRGDLGANTRRVEQLQQLWQDNPAAH